jgi:hypothetical protein
MKTLKIFALFFGILILAASCSQNHYAKGKRMMKSEKSIDASRADRRA